MKVETKNAIVKTLNDKGFPPEVVATVFAALEITEEQWNETYRTRYGMWVENIVYCK